MGGRPASFLDCIDYLVERRVDSPSKLFMPSACGWMRALSKLSSVAGFPRCSGNREVAFLRADPRFPFCKMTRFNCFIEHARLRTEAPLTTFKDTYGNMALQSPSKRLSQGCVSLPSTRMQDYPTNTNEKSLGATLKEKGFHREEGPITKRQR